MTHKLFACEHHAAVLNLLKSHERVILEVIDGKAHGKGLTC